MRGMKLGGGRTPDPHRLIRGNAFFNRVTRVVLLSQYGLEGEGGAERMDFPT